MILSNTGYFSLLFLSLMISFMGFSHLMANSEIIRQTIAGRKLILKIGDLTQERVDVIVNAANAQLAAGAGVCGAIRKAAGASVFDECEAILKKEKVKAIPVGQARMTGSGDLSKKGVKAIIHAVGPQGLNETELRSAYRNSLKLAEKAGYSSIAFPSISTGIFNYPVEEAATAALDEVCIFLENSPTHIQEVLFVFLDPDKTGDQTALVYKNALKP